MLKRSAGRQPCGEKLLLKTNEHKIANDWSSDGRFLLYHSTSQKTRFDLWILPLEGDRKPIPFLQSEFDETMGAFSPDGRWIAYTSDESGKYEVYVESFSGASAGTDVRSGDKSLVSTHGGRYPRWRRDGKELYYVTEDGKLMAVQIKSGTLLEIGPPMPLFDVDSLRYDVAADGQRFISVVHSEESASSPITIVVNWAAELPR